MKFIPSYGAALVLAFFASLAQAQESSQDLRNGDPVVKAVQQTINSVVAIRVSRQGEKDMIGSGLIVDESGLIVTNRHVTNGKKIVKVRLFDGTELVGEVVIADENQDLAVIRVNTKHPLPALRLAPTKDLMLMERVIAIGSPFGYDGTVTDGRISALNREIVMPNEVTMTGLIQHNAAINPGNSGGPLININGEVIGVNVALRDGAQGIAFAINASTVKNFLNKHFNAGKIAGVNLGMKLEEKILASVGDRQRIEVKTASNVSLKAGDQILAIGDRKVGNSFDVERALWNTKPGQQVQMKIARQGQGETIVMVTLGANQGAGQAAVYATETPVAINQPATGTVQTVNQR